MHLAENAEDEFEEIAVRRKILELAETVEANNVDSYHGSKAVMTERYNLHRRFQELKSSMTTEYMPVEFKPTHVYPNPFNSRISTQYEVPEQSKISLTYI